LLDDPNLEAVDVLSADFQWISRESDAILRVRSPEHGEFLVLNEIQLHYRADMPRRMRAYAGLAEERYKLPVIPVLVNILEPASTKDIPRQYFSTFLGFTARQDYRVINVWEVDAQLVLERALLPLLPFTPAMRGGATPELLQQALTLLRADQTLSELEPLLAFFASFVLDSKLVRKIMRWDMAVLRESPWYSEIAQEGFEEGLQRGMQQGMEQGLEKGIEEGRRDVAVQQLTNVLRHRFGSLPDALRDALLALPTEELLALFDIALEAQSLATFQAHTATNGTTTSTTTMS